MTFFLNNFILNSNSIHINHLHLANLKLLDRIRLFYKTYQNKTKSSTTSSKYVSVFKWLKHNYMNTLNKRGSLRM